MRLMLMISLMFTAAVSAESITPEQLEQNRDKVVLLDVRSTREFESGHIAGAIHIPVREVSARMGELGDVGGKMVVVYCEVGARARWAGNYLSQEGAGVYMLKGHMRAWRAAGRPVTVVEPKRP